MKVILDLDGVLVDFAKGACKELDVPEPILWPEDGDIVSALELDPSDFWDHISYSDFWKNLDWMPDGHEILEVLENHYGEENICICSSPTNCSEAAKGKMEWIQDHLPEYTKRFLIGRAKHFCAQPDSIMFDDFDFNVNRFKKNGGYAVLVPRPWNMFREYDTLTVIKGHLL